MTAPSDLIVPEMTDDTRQALESMQRLSSVLQRRQPKIEQRLAYYRGEHRLCYASEEFADYFGKRFEGFSDNWCQPVIASPAERMNVLGIRLDASSREADKDLGRVWRANDCERGSSETFVAALAASRGFGMVWGNPEDEDTPLITWERPDQTIVSYDPDTRRRRTGLKLWRDDDAGKEYATFATRTHLWKFERNAASIAGREEPSPVVLATGGWTPRQPATDDTWPIPNPLGAVPFVEFRNQTLLDDAPMSDIDGVIAMQDAINLIWAYLLNALDYASLSQRIVTGADIPKMPILDEQGQIVGYRPVELDSLIKDRILWVPGKDAKIGEWQPANLEVFSKVIERGVEHIAAQTRTPPHYLVGKVSNLAAEAFTAAETGLVSKTGERLTYFTPSIRELNALVALAQGNEAKAKAARGGTVMWADPQFRSLSQKVDALHKLKDIGFPFEWICEQYGLDPVEVDRVMKMKRKEAEMDPLGAITNELGRGRPPLDDEQQPDDEAELGDPVDELP